MEKKIIETREEILTSLLNMSKKTKIRILIILEVLALFVVLAILLIYFTIGGISLWRILLVVLLPILIPLGLYLIWKVGALILIMFCFIPLKVMIKREIEKHEEKIE